MVTPIGNWCCPCIKSFSLGHPLCCGRWDVTTFQGWWKVQWLFSFQAVEFYSSQSGRWWGCKIWQNSDKRYCCILFIIHIGLSNEKCRKWTNEGNFCVKYYWMFVGGQYTSECSAISTQTRRENRVQWDQRLPPLYHWEGWSREEREKKAVKYGKASMMTPLLIKI